ncbi:hypothetical protein Taro_007254 [Colocasia esculenta]|uniref:Uncharacterized protein n=1 Tax=Colocasia esculenta TaxID=4460 RepID=A0A843TQV1_COLES|nr:hypothetical protein [Colocasia esculenta]
MPRSSRNESSQRGHKHSSREARERSDSEEEGNSRERRSREEPMVAAASGSRVSRDLEYEKRKGSSSAQVSQGKEVAGSGNGEYSGDHGKKRKDRPAESGAAADRCNGGDGLDRLDDKELRGEEVGHTELEGKAKVKTLAVDSKGRSSRRHEGSSERKENSSGKDDSTKRRSEKEYSRRESSVHHKDVKDRERERGTERDREQGSERERERGSARDRERGSDRDRESGVHRSRENWLEKEKDRGSDREKKIQDGKRERSSDASSRRHGGKAGSLVEEECLVKEDAENAELLVQDELHSTELEKEVEKRVHKRDDFRDKDKWQEDIHDGENNVTVILKNDKWQGEGRDGEDRRFSSREVRTKNGGHKDEYHRDGSYRDKYRETVDRLQKHQDDKARDDCSSRDHNSDRSNSRHYRDEKGSSDNHYKRSKHQDSDHDGSPYTDDRGTKYKDGRGRKRPSDENDDHIDVKPRTKELCASLERNASYSYSVDCSNDRDRPENVFPDKVDFSTRPKSSPSSSVQYSSDQYRHSSKQMEAIAGNSLAEERSHMASPGNSGTASVVHERVTEHRSLEKSKPKGGRRVDELSVKCISSSKYERSPRSDGPGSGSPVQLTEKSPSSTSDRRRSNRASVRRSLDAEEMGQRGSILKDTVSYATSEDREQEQPKEKPVSDDRSQVDPVNNYAVPAGPSLNRPDNVSGGFPGHFPPPTRFGTDGPVLGSFDEDSRVLLGDRKSGTRYKRNMDFNMNRGQGNAWRGIQNWPSPVANGFIPFQHLPPSGGFHPVVQQFPPPSLFGIRPSMDMSHTGVPYPMHEAPDRFSSHARPFGWRNPADDSCPPHLQGWDGSNGIPMDESHIYRRPDWEQSRHMLGSRGWEMSIDVWKGQNGNNNMDLPVPQKELDYPTNVPPDETWAGQSASQPPSEVARSPAESNETKQSCETTPVKDAVELPPKVSYELTPEPSKPLKDDGAHFCRIYLSKLDISVDLVRPELYKQCMNLIGTIDGCSDVSKNHQQGIGGDTKVELKGSNLPNSHFPAIPDGVFQRAMSLYKAQNEDMKKKRSQPFCKGGEKKDSSSAEEKQDENLASEEATQDVVNPPGNGDDSISADAECIPADNPVEQPSDTMPTVVFVEDPQACEVIEI